MSDPLDPKEQFRLDFNRRLILQFRKLLAEELWPEETDDALEGSKQTK